MKDETKQVLLKIARDAIEAHLLGEPVPLVQTDNIDLLQTAGAFITLRNQGALRGCIGQMTSELPLYQVVQEKAVAAATQDPRFHPVDPHELSDLTIEISVLSPLEKTNRPEDIEVGKHGVLIEKSGWRGVLLPEVPITYGWNRTTFLDQVCIKAGLPPGSWKTGADLFVFTSEHFGDETIS